MHPGGAARVSGAFAGSAACGPLSHRVGRLGPMEQAADGEPGRQYKQHGRRNLELAKHHGI